MIPKIIHAVWLGNKEIDTKYLDGWFEKLKGYRFILHTNNADIKNLIDLEKYPFEIINVNTRDAIYYNELMNCKYYQTSVNTKRIAYASDMVRLYALKYYGGIYMDFDMEMVKRFDHLLCADYLLGEEDHAACRDLLICNCIMGFSPDNPMVNDLISFYKDEEFFVNNFVPGPTILTDVYKVKYSCIFKPLRLDYLICKSCLTGLIHKTQYTYTIHHYNISWQSKKSHNKLIRNQFIRRILGINKLTDFICDGVK